MTAPAVLFFGGNGHSAARLEAVRALLRARPDAPFELVDAEYPGFDGRERVASLEAFVDALHEAYAVELAERAWMNFSFFFRLMDHWGVPRRFVVAGVGGEGGGAADARLILSRFLLSGPRLLWLQLSSVVSVLRIRDRLAELDATIDAARSLPQLHAANVTLRSMPGSNNTVTAVRSRAIPCSRASSSCASSCAPICVSPAT